MEWQGWMRGGKRKEERWNNKKENIVFWEGKCSTFGKTNQDKENVKNHISGNCFPTNYTLYISANRKQETNHVIS